MDQKHCPYCGSENETGALTCTRCKGTLTPAGGVLVHEALAEVKVALAAKYEIVAQIGHGGNAAVYQAIQKNLDRKVALKVLLPHLAADAGFLERFHMEARAIAKLRHPNIVTIFDEGNENGIHYMAMEFLEGKDLHRLVKERGRLSVAEAVDMVRSIAPALDYAHSYGVVHRDVKSSNIIITSPRTAVLTDFGIAQSGYGSVKSKSGPILGTPKFMSPEQAAGRAVDARSDFYSLGVVLYHSLSGEYPFRGDTMIDTIHKILEETPVPIGRRVVLPPALEHAIDKCLLKDPSRRVQSGKELIALIDAPAPERSVRPVEAPVRKVKRRRVLPLMSSIVTAVLVCALLVGYKLREHSAKAIVHTNPTVLYENLEPPPKAVPSVVGVTKDEAVAILEREGFSLGGIRVVAVPSPESRGKVDSQRPVPGTAAKVGSQVDLFIGE
ncbi:MAG TPA: protein kinase [Bacteroidota bacterium]|nr:protein kinase [Bacteroidota bacterium]